MIVRSLIRNPDPRSPANWPEKRKINNTSLPKAYIPIRCKNKEGKITCIPRPGSFSFSSLPSISPNIRTWNVTSCSSLSESSYYSNGYY